MEKEFDFLNNLSSKQNMERAFEVYGNRLMGFINSYIKDVRQAEDLMMDVFVELLIRKPVFDNEFQFKSYIYKTAKTKSVNHLKKNNRLACLDEQVLEDTAELEDSLYKSALDKKLLESFKKLDYKYGQVLYLSYFEDMKNEQIAEVLGVSEKAVTNLKHRAKKKLSSILKRENFVFNFKEEV